MSRDKEATRTGIIIIVEYFLNICTPLIKHCLNVCRTGVGSSTVSLDFLDISPLGASRDLCPLLREIDPEIKEIEIRELLEDEGRASRVCYKVLDEVRKCSPLSERIASAYEARSKKMAAGEILLITGALVILAIRVKSVRWSSEEKEITFYKSSDAIKAFMSGLLRGL